MSKSSFKEEVTSPKDWIEESSLKSSEGGRELVDCVKSEGEDVREAVDSGWDGEATGKMKLPCSGPESTNEDGPDIVDNSMVAWRIVSCE